MIIVRKLCCIREKVFLLRRFRLLLNSKELNERFDVKTSNFGVGLVAKGRLSNHKNGGKIRWRFKFKTHGRKVLNSFKCIVWWSSSGGKQL